MAQSKTVRILKSIAVWVPTVLFGVFFTLQGFSKFPADSPWPGMFERWGYPAHFHLVIGAVELLAGLVLLVPRLAGWAALALTVVMLGAFGTHLAHGETTQSVFTLVITLALAALAWARLPRAALLGRLRRSGPSTAQG